MAEMDTEPDSEFKIWRLTGFGSGVLVSRFVDNFSDSAHLCLHHQIVVTATLIQSYQAL